MTPDIRASGLDQKWFHLAKKRAQDSDSETVKGKIEPEPELDDDKSNDKHAKTDIDQEDEGNMEIDRRPIVNKRKAMTAPQARDEGMRSKKHQRMRRGND